MRVGPRCGGEPPEELLAAAAAGPPRAPPLPIWPSGSTPLSLAEPPPGDPPLAGPFLLAVAPPLRGPARAEVEPATSASDRRAAAIWGRRTMGARQLKRTACRAVNAGNLRFW